MTPTVPSKTRRGTVYTQPTSQGAPKGVHKAKKPPRESKVAPGRQQAISRVISNPPGGNLLLKLPGELRNEVYRHVFAHCDLHRQPRNAFGLLRTSRQIYLETRLMSYSTISAKVAGDVSSWLLGCSPAQRAALKTIEFDCRSTTYPTNPALRFACWLFDNVARVKLQGLETIVMLLEAGQTNTMFWHSKASKEHIEVLLAGVEVKFEYPAGHG